MSRRSRDEQFDGQVVSDVATRDGLIDRPWAGPGETTERTRVTVATSVARRALGALIRPDLPHGHGHPQVWRDPFRK